MRSILVSVLVNIGDVIMMTSVLDLLRRHFPLAKITVLARPDAVELLQSNPVVDEVLVYPYKSGSLLKGLGGILKQIKEINPDVYLSLDRRPRGALAAFLAGIKQRVGPDYLYGGSRSRFWTKLLLYTKIATLTPDECEASQVEMFQLVARRGLGLEGLGRITLPPTKPETVLWVEEILAEARGRPVIGLCVKTNDPMKTWPLEGYALLIRRLLHDLEAFIYITGSPADRPYVEKLLSCLPPQKVLNLAGTTSLSQAAALAVRSSLFITPDNGIAHLVANSGRSKLICILGGTTMEKIADSMPEAKFITLSANIPNSPPANLEQEAEELFNLAASYIKS